MRIVVYGAGAVGSFWGALLARGGHDVRFVARGEQLRAMQAEGLRISSTVLGEVTVKPVTARATAAELGPADLVLVCVKAHQTPAILDDLDHVAGERTVFIAVQNGVDGDDILISRFGRSRVMGAVVYVGVSLEQPGSVRHVARGLLLLGNPYDVPSELADAVVSALNVPGLRARLAGDFNRQRWYKLMWNTSFNGVSALTLATSTTMLAIPEVRETIVESMREVVAVAGARGVPLTPADVEKSIAETERLPPIKTSTLVDREHGRELETEALVGVVVRLGKEAGVPTPVTSMLYGLLKALGSRVLKD